MIIFERRNFRRRKLGKWFNKINTMGTTLYRHLEHRERMEDGVADGGRYNNILRVTKEGGGRVIAGNKAMVP